ncbi:MAG TPA: hypothetical protein VED41_05155 [Solirubrobacteraceae bacterium]|nr:hypothetical protein [Solirubrobacteraceae bacterium]
MAVPTALAALAGIVTNWNTLSSAVFPAVPATKATIVAHVEPDISLREFEVQDQLPTQRSSAAAVVPGGSHTPGFGNRFAVYAVPASTPSTAGRFLAVSSEEPAKSSESTTIKNSAEQKAKEGEKVTEEAKRAEESAAREKAQAASELKEAEAREQEERKKEQEERKKKQEAEERAEAQGAATAKAEEAKARKAVAKAKETVRAKKQETVRPPSQRRIEAGTPAGRVEEVLHEADLPKHCRPTCGLKPIVEKVLKVTSNNAAAAAQEVRAVNPSSGARVHYEVTLKGLEHKVVVLTYSLVQTNGAPPPEPYLGTVAIKTVAPAHEPEVVRGICWVPLPSSTRQYYLDLTVYDGETEVESQDTSRFW